MNRLTIRNSDGTVSQPMDLRWADALEKLAHYEDLEEQGLVAEYAEWETVTEIKNNTTCGDNVKLTHKQCSRCKQPMGLSGDYYCGHCGAKMGGIK